MRIPTVLLLLTMLSVPVIAVPGTDSDGTGGTGALADFKNAVCNLGQFSSSDTVQTVRFSLHNIGSSTLEISGAETSCSCTSVAFSEQSVAPGDSAVISVTYNAADKWPGIVNQAARIECNAENSPLYIRITGFMVER